MFQCYLRFLFNRQIWQLNNRPLHRRSKFKNGVFWILLAFTSGLSASINKRIDESTATSPSHSLAHPKSESTASYATQTYFYSTISSLAELVTFKTFAKPDLPLKDDPEFAKFNQSIKTLAEQLNLTFTDHGSVLLISIGEGPKVLGLITHGDVQPANASKWLQNPFTLDTTSEPGKLIARGTEDDKAPIVAAMYALKAIKDKQITLNGKVELLIYMAEESDWSELKQFLKSYQPAPVNVALDSEYPVVTAEKAWSHIDVRFADLLTQQLKGPHLISFKGGAFTSQIPEEAIAEASGLSESMKNDLTMKLQKYPVDFQMTQLGKQTLISVKGKAAHSSKPNHGINAIAYLAEALKSIDWMPSQAANAVNYLGELAGVGVYGEQFGNIAYSHPFMGPMTLSPTQVIKDKQGLLKVFINIRRPLGKSQPLFRSQIEKTLTSWQQRNQIKFAKRDIYIGKPLLVENAPHVPKLLNVFAHFTGTKNPEPIAIGGSTNAKLIPNTVSFGPSMPGTEYTGHSEHEFITEEQLKLTLAMYTAMIIEIAGQ